MPSATLPAPGSLLPSSGGRCACGTLLSTPARKFSSNSAGLTSAAGSNHLAGPDGSPAFHPSTALTHAADQWNLIFGVHQAGIPVEPLMRPIQNLLEQRAVTLDLGPVSPEDLMASVARRSVDSSARELQALPVPVFRILAFLFKQVEASRWDMPRILGTARLAVLDTGAPLSKRLIAALPISYLAWSSACFRAPRLAKEGPPLCRCWWGPRP